MRVVTSQSVPGFSMFDARRVSTESSPTGKMVKSFFPEMTTAINSRTVSATETTCSEL